MSVFDLILQQAKTSPVCRARWLFTPRFYLKTSIPEQGNRVAGAIADIFDPLISTLADTRLEPDLDGLLWSTVNLFPPRREPDRAQRAGSVVNHRNLTAAMIDSREFLAAKKRAETEVLLPAGPKIAFPAAKAAITGKSGPSSIRFTPNIPVACTTQGIIVWLGPLPKLPGAAQFQIVHCHDDDVEEVLRMLSANRPNPTR